MTTTATPRRGESPAFAFPVVGIGASAGGLDALRELFRHLPKDVGAALVVVQHLSADRPSHLAELLERCTAMPVTVASDGVELAANHVYVAAPGKTVRLACERLRAVDDTAPRRRPIDAFLRSLAEEHGELAIAVILSGEGDDGAAGARAVEEQGGVSLVQLPSSAAHETMPRSALALGRDAVALSVPDLARALVGHIATVAGVCQGPHALSQGMSEVPAEIWNVLRDVTGRDLSGYKAGTVARRIARRMQALDLTALAEYLQRLRSDPGEAPELLQQLLISVTSFFRDEEVFAALEERILPRLVREASAGDLRIWVPGCATGEEAYSIAMLAREAAERAAVTLRLQVFGTDLDAHALDEARAGRYDRKACAPIAPARLERFFVESGDEYVVSKELRECCAFSVHHLTSDPPFSRLDLLSCRNVLIYLDGELKRQVLPIFHYALRPDGVLVLGPSEGISEQDELFHPLDAKLRLYARRDARPRTPPRFRLKPRGGGRTAPAPVATLATPRPGAAAAVSFEQLLLRELGPACAVVDTRGQVLHLSGPVGRFLEPPQGPPSQNVLDLAREGLRLHVRTALHKAAKERREVVQEQLPLRVGERPVHVDVVVRPWPDADAEQFLVLFREREVPAAEPEDESGPGDGALVARLRAELRSTQEHLETAIEELEVSNAQLKSSNEELLTVNEELQSANEELQTSQEELQSLNEELETVNTELSAKVELLDRTNADLQNLLRGSQLAAVFLGRDLAIRKFTPAATQLFRILDSDVGRPITDLVAFAETDLGVDVAEVLRTLTPREHSVRLDGGNAWFALRVLPYLTLAGEVDGAAITFTDITELMRADQAVRESERRYREVLQAIPQLVWTCRPDGAYDFLSRQWVEYTGIPASEQLGYGWLQQLHPDDRDRTAAAWRAAMTHDRPYDVEFRLRRHDGVHRWFTSRGVPLRDADGRTSRWFGSCTDVDDLKRADAELRQAARRKDEFLALLGHELRNPLAALMNALRLAQRDEGAAAERLPVMGRQVEQLARLVDDLLDVERIARGKVMLRREYVDLARAVRAAVDDQGAAFTEGGVALELRLPDAPLPVQGDAIRLAQALGNVLQNARKFTERGGVVTVQARRTFGTVEVTVRDTGVGMEPSFAEQAFEPFTQEHSHLADRNQNGLGLGLSLVRTVLEGLGGGARAHSDGRGRGTEVVLWLPAVDAAEEGAALPGRTPAPATPPPSRILVVDDNEDAAVTLGELLELEGHDVRVAPDGTVAVAMARQFHPDLMLCDIGLPPPLDGYGVARAFREDPALRACYLVALTGYATADHRQRATDAGFDRHLAKPPSLTAIAEAVQAARRRAAPPSHSGS